MRNLFKLNDKGSTFVTVIVTIGFIGVLASLVLVVTQNSYVTKSVDNQAKVNFYDSEEVVDQLKIGLQNELCECMIDAYFEVIANFNVSDTEAQRIQQFNKATIGNNSKGFISRIGSGSGNTVKPEKLRELISEYYLADSQDKFSINGKKDSSCNIFYEVAGDFSTITLRNVGVEYVNSSGYVNSLFTDIVVKIPKPDFSMFEPDPDTEYEKYAIMARNDVNNNANVLNSKGSVWIGNYANITGSASRFITDGEVMYINGGVKTTNTAHTASGVYAFSTSNGGNKNQLYTGNLITDNTAYSYMTNAIKINSTAYVKNDLVFEGNYAHVDIDGTYEGIGQDDEDPDMSSAIIVNGKCNRLNIDTDSLLLAGNSYIKTFNNGDYTVPNSDSSILTGDALSIRSNELAYLVPSEYMQGLPNPVTRSDLNGKTYDQLLTLIKGAVTSDSSISGLLEPGKPVRVLYYTYSNDPNDRVAYYYLNFDSASSGANFYMNKVNSQTQKRNMLLGLIPVEMTVNSTNFGIGGMYVERLYANTDGLTSSPTFTKGSGNTGFVIEASKKYNKVRSFLTYNVPAKLQQQDAAMSADKKFSGKDAIDIVIDWDAINEDSNNGLILNWSQLNDGTGNSILGYPVSGSNTGTQLQVRIYKGGTYNLTESITGVVIGTGDINVANNVTVNGLIIAGGSINIQGNANFIADPVVTKNVFDRSALVKTLDGVFLNRILNGYQVNNMAEKEVPMSTLQLEGMFTYENWCRN